MFATRTPTPIDAEAEAVQTPAQSVVPLVASPSAGGSYLRDPVTGVLTLDIPPTISE